MATSIRIWRPRAASDKGKRGRALGVVAACVGLTFGVAACGARAANSPSPTSSNSDPSYEVTTGAVNGLGTVLVDGQGFTLYLFVPDDHSSRSLCIGICAIEWPPLLLPKGTSAPRAGGRANPALLGMTTRAGGSVQVTYNGWPLYLWPDDLSPGQATGQGLNNVGGLWYVVSPRGNPIRS
jgi:predicted lipoprotein with Yx(FWY)xxD motif